MSTESNSERAPKKKQVAKKRTTRARRRPTSASSASMTGTARPKKDEVTPHTPVSATASLLALSPYRFPMDIERVIINSVRVSGFAVVILGLFATYHYIESSASELAIRASQTASVSAAVTCGEECLYERRTPPVSFSYGTDENAPRTIDVSVANAERVTLYAFDPTSEQFIRLGVAGRISGDSWRFVWSTEDVRPGQYWLKAVVENRFGVYDRSDSRYLEVQ